MKEFFEFVANAAVWSAIVIGSLFAVFTMCNSMYKVSQSYSCSESGGIPVEVANYIHCHE